MTMAMPRDLVLSLGRYWRTRALLLIARKAYGIHESRNDFGSKRQRRKFRLRKLCTRVGLGRLEGTTVRSRVFPRSSKVFVWDRRNLT